MNANVNAVKLRAVYGEFGVQDTMNLFDIGLVEVTASDPRLVGDQYCLHSAVINLSDRRSRPGKTLIEAGTVHITDVFGYSSVPIHEEDPMRYAPTNSRASR